jgi:hypothetical protein
MNRRFDIYALGVTSALMSMARTTPAQERKLRRAAAAENARELGRVVCGDLAELRVQHCAGVGA